jgi:hypothetical protein
LTSLGNGIASKTALDSFRRKRIAPNQHMLEDAVDQRAIQVERNPPSPIPLSDRLHHDLARYLNVLIALQ